MAYFAGKNLDRKIEEFDLKDLEEKLQSIIQNMDRKIEEIWPPDKILQISADADILESLRIVIYSLLHRYALKDEFIVRAIPSLRLIEVSMKKRMGRKTGMAFVSTEARPSERTVETEETDLTGIFEE